ncbi:hypothetical protein [Amycolatopsis sp. VC5-11]|uniref:hypothetical protein n=1 Tax=Amycolatopsis sp. VC5-11 TaxID=3120156 RepID=UPI0030087410
MLSFQDAYTLWRWLPFPRGVFHDVLAGTKGDLAGADEYVTTVIRFVERGIFIPAPVDVLADLDRIIGRIEAVNRGLTEEEQISADQQHAYAVLLKIVYAGFLSQAPAEP